MRKSEKTVQKRRAYIKNQMDTRHKSETADMCVKRLANELFLSESTIWKDYANS